MAAEEELGRLEPGDDGVYEHLKKEITKRLRDVCERLPDREFDELVRRPARLQLNYPAREGH